MLLEPIPPQDEKAILDEIGYDKEKLSKDVATIKKWLEFQHHLPPCRNNEPDAFISNFIIGCKGSLEKCKQKLDAYYTFRSECSQMFGERDPETLIKNCDTHFLSVLPKPINGARVYCDVLINSDVSKIDNVAHFKRSLNMADLLMRMDPIIGGLYFIIDVRNFTNNHLVRQNPVAWKNIATFVQDAMPYRLKGMYFINAPPVFEIAINKLIKQFFKSKLLERIQVFTKGPEVMKQFFDPKFLPKDYGGDCPSFAESNEKWSKHAIAETKWFINEGSQKNDETKRSKDSHSNPYLGVQGSLKQLVVD